MRHDLRETWALLKFWEELEKENGRSYQNYIRNYKERIRLQRRADEINKDPYIVNTFHCTYDGYFEKIVAEDNGETLDEVEEFFQDNYHIDYYDRGFDCTGQKFTSFHKIFKCAGNWIIYHYVAIDC